MGKPLPVISSQAVCTALAKVGFVEIPGRGKGSHTFLYRQFPAKAVTVPHQREVKRGTLRAIIRQADLTFDEFVDLL